MLAYNLQVFDEIIAGTTDSWCTPVQLNSTLAQSDIITVMATTNMVSGTSPGLYVAVEHSADARLWVQHVPFFPIVQAPTIANNTSYWGSSSMWLGVSQMSFARLKINLVGTNPKCRVIIGATGRYS